MGRYMDAIDALMCLGFSIRKGPCGVFVLIGFGAWPAESIEAIAVRSLLKETYEQLEFHQKLIQQKGAALGT
jgi:hypothetical protein